MAREKHVFNGKDAVAHEWSRQCLDHGREGDRLGVRIALDDAYRHYDRLKSLQFRFNGQGYLSTNDQGSEFDGYRLRNITAEYFEIGCHKIEWAELDSVAKAAGFPAWKVEGVAV